MLHVSLVHEQLILIVDIRKLVTHLCLDIFGQMGQSFKIAQISKHLVFRKALCKMFSKDCRILKLGNNRRMLELAPTTSFPTKIYPCNFLNKKNEIWIRKFYMLPLSILFYFIWSKALLLSLILNIRIFLASSIFKF